MAVSVGSMAGVWTVVGMAILNYRRRTVGPVFSATTRMDKTMYVFLATMIVLGLVNTVVANIFGHYDYPEGVSVWFRGIFRYSLHPDLMTAAPHAAAGRRSRGLTANGRHPTRCQRSGFVTWRPQEPSTATGPSGLEFEGRRRSRLTALCGSRPAKDGAR